MSKRWRGNQWVLLFLSFLLGLLIVILPFMMGHDKGQVATAYPTTAIPAVNRDGAVMPDWSRITLGSLPPVTEPGSFVLPPEIVEQLGYDPSRSWQAGETADAIMSLGDFEGSFDMQEFSLVDIAERALDDPQLDQLSLADFGPMEWQTVGDLVQAIPGLAEFPLAEVPPILDLLLQAERDGLPIVTEKGKLPMIGSRWQDLNALTQPMSGFGQLTLARTLPIQVALSKGDEAIASQTIDSILKLNPKLAQFGFGVLPLANYALKSIPGLDQIPIKHLKNWQKTLISKVPGLKNVPLEALPNPLDGGYGYLAQYDVTYGPAERRRTNTITGSDVEGFKVPCPPAGGDPKTPCPYIELNNSSFLGIMTANSLHGAQWIDGKNTPWVRGGHGFLGALFGGREPTGRLPYGKTPFKVVLTGTNESDGSAQFGLYFRFCRKGTFVDLGCTPYMFGPFPWFSNREKDLIFVGLTPGTAPGVEAPPMPQAVQDAIDKYGGEGESGDEVADDCEKYKGIHLGALKQAISNIESLGSGGHSAIGDYVCDKDGLCGRALGKYQFMTYKEIARNAILSKAGGAEFLRRANVPDNSSVYKLKLGSELQKYFPPELQEKVLNQHLKGAIDRASGQGFNGDALIGRVGEIHNAGEYSQPGAAPDYAGRTRDEYSKIRPQKEKACAAQVCKGNGRFMKPSSGPFTSPYGWRTHPLTGQSSFHAGLDIGSPHGSRIVAGDCGKVRTAGWLGGYGNTVEIEHGNGYVTLYGHMSRISVRRGQNVKRGQKIGEIGSTGRSTGPHLHFEVHKNGGTLDPAPLIG